MKIRLDFTILKIYFYLIPFLHPRGLEFFPILKILFTEWLYVSIVLIVLEQVYAILKKRKQNNKFIFTISLYYIVMFLITLLVRREFSDALQRIFAAPIFCILCANYLENEAYKFIKTTNNLFILIFVLSLTIFSPRLWPDLFDPVRLHYTFLGHVQVNVQLGIVSFFLAYAEHYYWPEKRGKRFIIQTALSLIIMALSSTSASYIVLILLALFWLMDRMRFRKVFEYPGKMYILVYIFINVFLFWFVLNVNKSIQISIFNLNGRGHIWNAALDSFFASPIYGYGVHGVMIKVFWYKWSGTGEGTNYMHNQILQILNDGGILLLIPFVYMLHFMMDNIVKIGKGKIKFWATATTIILFFIMIFESAMNYYYIFLLFSVMSFLPQIDNISKNKLSGKA